MVDRDSHSSFYEVVVLGAGAAGLTAALAFPECLVIGPETPPPPYNLEIYEPLASRLGLELDEERVGNFWVGGKSYSAPLQLSREGGLYTSAILNAWRTPDPDKSFVENNRVWGRAGDHITNYSLKKLCLSAYLKEDRQTVPTNIWQPPGPTDRMRRLWNRSVQHRASSVTTKDAFRLLEEARKEADVIRAYQLATRLYKEDDVITIKLTDGAEFKCRYLINTVPLPQFQRMYSMPIPQECLRYTGIVTIHVQADPVDHHFDIFSDHTIAAQRVTHDAEDHYVEVVVPQGAGLTNDYNDASDVSVVDWVRELNALDIFDGPVSIVDSSYSPFGYPYTPRQAQEKFEVYKEGMEANGIYNLGRWSAWKPVITSDVYAEALRLSEQLDL